MSPRDSVPHFDPTFALFIANNNIERLKFMINRVKTIIIVTLSKTKAQDTFRVETLPALLYNDPKFTKLYLKVPGQCS